MLELERLGQGKWSLHEKLRQIKKQVNNVIKEIESLLDDIYKMMGD